MISLRCAAASAATAARTEIIATYAATVLVTVTFQVVLRPSRHGIDVNPSGIIIIINNNNNVFNFIITLLYNNLIINYNF